MNCLNKQQLQPDDKCMIIIPLVKKKYMSKLILKKSLKSYITKNSLNAVFSLGAWEQSPISTVKIIKKINK